MGGEKLMKQVMEGEKLIKQVMESEKLTKQVMSYRSEGEYYYNSPKSSTRSVGYFTREPRKPDQFT